VLVTSLTDLRVIDLSTLFAGPTAAMMMADFGADVIKIEHPRKGDPVRGHGAAVDGVGLWWKTMSRNKRAITLDVSTPDGQDVLRALVRQADVIIENFRPGTLERWGLSPETLQEINPRLVIGRMTGFGQFGPMSAQPGFGTIAEAMSGFAAVTGEPDGPPTLPPLGLADGIAGITMAYAVMVALHARQTTGRGQVIDLAIIEPMLSIVGSLVTAYKKVGIIPERTGNRSNSNAPRNVYRSLDGKWLAVSTSAQSIAERVVTLVGREDLVREPWFATGHGRVQHVEELDAAVGSWIAERKADEVIAEFGKAQAAIAPIYTVADIATDPQFTALGSFVNVEDEELGELSIQGPTFRLSETPGTIRWAGPAKGQHTDEVLTEAGLTNEQIAVLRKGGVIA
jgi:crotonobetainyl-CoA:carnitine CoA-transferase CaiB-like acyl-CoA transferase